MSQEGKGTPPPSSLQKNEADLVFRKWKFLGYDLRPDYTLLIYPIHVWATNRMLHTMIARDFQYYQRNKKGKQPLGLMRDARQILRMHGPLAFFGGITPYLINHLFNNLEIFGDPDSEYADPRGYYWYYFTVFFWNPLNIMIVRMQCVEFPIKSFRAAWLDMFYRGFFPIFTGQLQLWFFMNLAYLIEDLSSHFFTPYICAMLFLMGCAACHPWYLVGMRIQYNRFHPPAILHREGYSNTLKGILYVKKTEGLFGLWRGLVPALFVYGASYFEDLHRMVFSKVKPQIKDLYSRFSS
jgi:hypothetical protein